MAVIGITGGAGTGKSFVAKIAADGFDMLHIDTDRLARAQMMPGGVSYPAVAGAFPECIGKSGEFDRAILAARVFGDEEALKKLEDLTHPNVRKAVEALIESSAGLFKHVLIETAILANAGYCSLCDAVWLVTAPPQDRKKRLAERGYSEERIESVLAAQPSDEEYRETSTFEIKNPEGADVKSITEQLKEAMRCITDSQEQNAMSEQF